MGNKEAQKTPEGHDVSVPPQGDFLRDLKRAASPAKDEKPMGS